MVNVADETYPTDAITLKQHDAVDFETITKNIDLRDTYNIINSKQQTFNEINANRNTLVCYGDVRDVFVSSKESVFPIQTHFDGPEARRPGGPVLIFHSFFVQR